MLALEGQQLGNYDVIRRIRVGGMGAVYEGRQRTAFGRRVAIKVILGDYAADRDMRRRFAREARTIARLHHPHILPLIEFGVERGILYLVMPFIEGGTLTSYLRRTLPPLDEVASIFGQLLDAVEYAHEQGLVHRDIKSSNVLLEERRSGPPHIYLADFGLVRTRRDERDQIGRSIPLDQVPGTPHYMAPEQTRGIVTPLTDIYALGVLLFQLLTGELPYVDEDDVQVIQMHLHDPIPLPSERDASVPRELDEIVRKAMAKRPDARYRSVGEMRRAFQAAVPAEVSHSSEPATSRGTDQLTGNKRISEALERKKKPTIRPSEKLKRDSEFVIEDVEDTYSGAPGGLRRLPEALEIVKPAEIKQEDTTDVIRQRITEEPTIQPGPIERRRITEDQPRKSQRARGNVVATIAGSLASRSQGMQQKQKVWLSLVAGMSLVLIALLLMPRVFGYSFFPSGFPVFGTPPVATIYVTLQTRNMQDNFLLTASPQVKQADVVAHTIPARVIQQSGSTSGSAATTGNQNSPGTRASGILTIINGSNKTVTVPVHQIITTSSGIRLETLELISISPHDRNDVRAQALTPGVTGNIAAHAADGSCCSSGVIVRNSAPFTGGTDPQGARIVQQADIDKLKASLVSKVEQNLQQQLKQQLQNDELMGGNPELKTEAIADHQAGEVADQISMTVTVTASVGTYKRADAVNLAGQLLRAQAIQALESSYQQQGELAIGQPNAQAGKDGVVYVNINAKGTWSYILNDQTRASWLQSIRGATSDAALAYLSARPGVAAVQITLPFGADHLPTNTGDIKIVIV